MNRFPTLGVKTTQPFRWNRITVHLPCFMTEHSWTVRWKRFEIVSVVVHRSSEPNSGHYQACLRTGGSRFLTDDWSRALPCAHTPDLEQDLYLLWLVDSGHLTSAWKSLLHCNPFVPFPTSQMPSFDAARGTRCARRSRSMDRCPTRAELPLPEVNNNTGYFNFVFGYYFLYCFELLCFLRRDL